MNCCIAPFQSGAVECGCGQVIQFWAWIEVSAGNEPQQVGKAG